MPNVEELKSQTGVRVFNGKGRTLMSGLGDGHTHFSWNGGDLDQLGSLGVEEHTLLTMRSAQCFLDSGYTMCFGAASAKERLDVVIRNAINAGDIPGPRYLANGKEMARHGGELVGGITAYADGPEEMRKVIKHHVDIGVDNIKLSMSGESVRFHVLHSPSHVWCIVLLLLVIGFVASGLPLAGVGMTCTGSLRR